MHLTTNQPTSQPFTLAPFENASSLHSSTEPATWLPSIPKVALIACLFLGMGLSLAEVFTFFG